ncbi:hypothetical protein SteCoe_38540 [Stentor coeruleus]|uniref:Uncharacterized protein n=1 Tax=Stentor coeruleus TaxID=5963 RepID=A0A1R2ALD3_9CILI|nr:hypothetical protein SteCoe_38540 [Stentor coeruleus]
MKILSEISLELVLEKRYAVKIICVGHAIKAYSKDLKIFREWSGPIIGLSINMLVWLKERSTWATSRFSLNPETLEVMFLTGLKGGSDSISINKQGSFHKYEFQLENIEKQFTIEAELKNHIQDLIITEFEMVNQLKWEEFYILLDFVENCAKQDKLSEEFILRVITSYNQNLRENKAWQIREKVANLLI